MSELLTINTEQDIPKQTVIEPLPLFGEDHFMLQQSLPEYTEALPNPIMNKLIDRLKVTMRMYNGLGLSANQCGVATRVFVMYEDKFMTKPIACINPQIVGWADEKEKMKEGCLSYPGLYLLVPRSSWLVVEYTTPNGERVQTKLEGVAAQCFAHEVDHMNGVRFADYVGPLALKLAKQRRDKMIKRVSRKK